jgi:hypothetical protein
MPPRLLNLNRSKWRRRPASKPGMRRSFSWPGVLPRGGRGEGRVQRQRDGQPKQIAIVVPPNAQLLDISGPMDAFLEANRLSEGAADYRL